MTVTWTTILTEDLQVDLIWNELLSRTLGVVAGQVGDGLITTNIPISTETAAGYKVRVSSLLSSTIIDESDHDFIIGILDNHTFLPQVNRP